MHEDRLISLAILSGFLGSGKATLPDGLLKTAELANSAVIINEFIEQTLDHFIEAARRGELCDTTN